MAVTFVFSSLVILFNLIADLLYGWLDPRISLPLAAPRARGARPLPRSVSPARRGVAALPRATGWRCSAWSCWR